MPSMLGLLASRIASGADRSALAAKGYGPLVSDPARLLALPRGFHYRALSTGVLGSDSDPRFTQRMTNGELVPSCHDGMAAFSGAGGVTVLVRNHENEPEYWPV